MNEGFQTNNKCVTIVKLRKYMTLLIILFCIMINIQNVMGQDENVIVTYNENAGIVTIENNTSDEIVLFPSPSSIIAIDKILPKGRKFEVCGISTTNRKKHINSGNLIKVSSKKAYKPLSNIGRIEEPVYYYIPTKDWKENKAQVKIINKNSDQDNTTEENKNKLANKESNQVNEFTENTTDQRISAPAVTADKNIKADEKINKPRIDAKITSKISTRLLYYTVDSILISYEYEGLYDTIIWIPKCPNGVDAIGKSSIRIEGQSNDIGTYTYEIKLKGKNGGKDFTSNKIELKIIEESQPQPSKTETKKPQKTQKSKAGNEEEYNKLYKRHNDLDGIFDNLKKELGKNDLKNLLEETKRLRDNVKKEQSSFDTKKYPELKKLYDRLDNEIRGFINTIIAKNLTVETIADYDTAVLSTKDKDSVRIENVKNEIQKRENQSTLFGWIGTTLLKDTLKVLENDYDNIRIKSADFITERKKQQSTEDRDFLSELKNRIPPFYEEINTCKERLERIKVPYVMLSIIGISLLLLLVGIIYYIASVLKNKRIAKEILERSSSDEGGIVIEDDDTIEIISYAAGLSEVKEKVGADYYQIDMRPIFEDSTIRYVYISRKCILDIYKFFSVFLKYDHKTNETGCFLIGRWENVSETTPQEYDISIEALVEPSEDAIYGEYNLNFGAKIEITLNYAIENLREKTGNEYVHTAWMHSHPGLGLFLSSQDLNVQWQLAYSDHRGRMLAIVLDSNTPDLRMAFFAPKHDGSMNNDKDMKQILSLEGLYQWAKTSPSNKEETTFKQNYYSIKTLSKTSKIKEVLFSGSTIIDMDTTIMPNTSGLQGYFWGAKRTEEIILDIFKDSDEKSTPPLACLLVVQSFSYQQVLAEYKGVMNSFDCSVVYCTETANIYVIIKDEREQYPATKDQVAFATLMEMKEWTRRRR